MWKACQLGIIALVFLSSCGDAADKENEGTELFSRYMCFTCHSLDGRPMYGPPLNDLYLKEVTVLRQGRQKTIVAKRKYLKKSITDPDYEKVLDYENRIMPEPNIPREDLEILVDYLIELGEEE